MISTSFNAESVYLLNDSPDWRSPVRARFELLTQLDASLSDRESRRPHSATLRTALSYSAVVQGADARTLKASLRDYQRQPVIVPFWPAQTFWGSLSDITGGLFIVWTPTWSQWGIYEAGGAPVWPTTNDFVAPALFGFLERRGTIWLRDDLAEFRVEFIESGPTDFALNSAASNFPSGPQPAGYAAAPYFAVLKSTGESIAENYQVEIIRERIGFGRGPAETLYTQTNAAETALACYADSQDEAAKFLLLFTQHGGGKSFWAANWSNAATLAADVGASDTVLSVTAPHALKVDDYVALLASSDATPVTRKVTGVTASTVTLASAPGSHSADSTIVAQLLLCRFDKPVLEIDWQSPELAFAKLPVRELPPEYVPAADETLGTTIGLLTTRGYLYEFSRTLNGTTYTDRYTSYERDLTFGGNTYTAEFVSHGSIRKGLHLDRDEVEVTSQSFTGNPLLSLLTLSMEAPLFVTIRSVDVSGSTASNGAVLFSGEINTAKMRGSTITARSVRAGTIFDRLVPRFLIQPGCNHALFSVGCGLLPANWKFTAVVSAPGTAGYPYTFGLSTLARVTGATPTYFADWFAGGWIEFGSGSSLQRRTILQSTNPVAGALTITTNRDPVPFPSTNDPVVLYPGCDGRGPTCLAYGLVFTSGNVNTRGKFDNYLNFGGHPFVPKSNPSIVRFNRNAAAGGKK